MNPEQFDITQNYINGKQTDDGQAAMPHQRVVPQKSCAPCVYGLQHPIRFYTGRLKHLGHNQTTTTQMEKLSVKKLQNVSETLLIPLYFKAKETAEDGILYDPVAVKAIDKINYDFHKFDKDRLSQTGVAVRTILLDLVLEHLSKTYPDLIVVNLGAGLDTRPEKNPELQWFNIDFKEVIELREKIFAESISVNFEQSIFDFSWIEKIPARRHVLFICEGVLMYLEENLVKQLFLKLASEFSESHIAFDTVPKFMVGRRHASVDTTKAPFKWGNNRLRDITSWNASLSPVTTYQFADFFKEKWSWMRLLYLVPAVRKGFKIGLIKIN